MGSPGLSHPFSWHGSLSVEAEVGFRKVDLWPRTAFEGTTRAVTSLENKSLFCKTIGLGGAFSSTFTLVITIHSFLLVTLGFPRCRGGPETVADRTGKPVRSGKTSIL